MLNHVSIFHSFLLFIVWIYHLLFIHLIIDGQLGFHLLVVMTRISMNIHA